MKKISSVVFIVAFIGILFASCAQSPAPSASVAATASAASSASAAATAATLPGAEVRQYQGKDLSFIAGINDNAIVGPQDIDITTYHLEISGMVNTPQQLTYDHVLSLTHYKKVVIINCVDGWSATILWEGVLLNDLFDKAGIQSGANTVVFTGSDGYTTSLPLDYIVNNQIILASMMNGLVIPAWKGFPFMVVAQDKLGYKWAKWVTKIELTNDPSFKGYWESRGLSNDANV